MPWNVHFDGTKLTAIDDATFAETKSRLLEAAAHGSTAIIGLSTETRSLELFWTPGCPIYFERVDEETVHS